MKADIYELVEVKLDDLVHPEYNNIRSATGEEARELANSIRKHGFIDHLIVNKNKDRKNIIVAGNFRVRICKELGYTHLPAMLVDIADEKEERELSLRHNKNTGHWDEDKFPEYFTKDFMIMVGFKEGELKAFLNDFDKKVAGINNDDVKYPIVPKLSEKYNYVLVIAENEIDLAYLENYFGLKKEKSYKKETVGVGRVVTFEQFKKSIGK